MTAPETIVRAILASGPSPQRTVVLAALGLGGDGQPCTDQEREEALSQLVGNAFDPQDAAQQTLPAEEEGVPF